MSLKNNTVSKYCILCVIIVWFLLVLYITNNNAGRGILFTFNFFGFFEKESFMSIEKDKILFVGFNRHVVGGIKDILHKRQQDVLYYTVFQDDVQKARDIIASDFVDITAIFLNINPKYIDGIAGVCGYVASIASLVQDALESDIAVFMSSCSLKRYAFATLFGELDKKQNEDFMVIGNLDTEYLPALISSIQKTKQQKYATV